MVQSMLLLINVLFLLVLATEVAKATSTTKEGTTKENQRRETVNSNLTNVEDATVRNNRKRTKISSTSNGDSRHSIVKRNANTTDSSGGEQPTTKAPEIFVTPPPLPPPMTQQPTTKMVHVILTPPPLIPIVPPVCKPEKSCLGRCSTNNRTQWSNQLKFTCSCDPDCYEVFHDCCTDYQKYCGPQKSIDVPTKKYKWTCEAVGHYDLKLCNLGEGIWMVSDCDHNWPNDETRNKCETPVKRLTLSSPDVSRYLPVVSHDNITFRNLHCALCNKVDTCEPWPVTIETTVIPPEHYNFTQKIKFLLLYAARFPETGPSRPKSSQPRRYCVKQVINSCPANKPSSSCTNGTTALVSSLGPHYKNIECAICHNFPTFFLSCFPTHHNWACQGFLPLSFSLVLDYRRDSVENEEKSVFSIEKVACGGQGMIYDASLQVCQVNWLNPPDNSGQERFYVVAWLVPRQSKISSFTPDDFQKSLVEYLNIPATQLFNINISTNLHAVFYLVSSTIVLTPQQSLELLSQNKNSDDTWQLRIQEFIHFKNPIPLIIGNTNYTIVKTTSRPLVCTGRKVYSHKEYTLLDNDKVFINSTNTTYEKSQYFTENITLGNITICEKYSPPGCNETWTIFKPNEFIILSNLSIVNKKTSQLYHYGEYDVLSNSSVAVCPSTPQPLIPIIQPVCEPEKSCLGRCSTNNRTQWSNQLKFTCSCDPDCYEVFHDCCTDYQKYCGPQKFIDVPTKKYKWTCEAVGHYDLKFCNLGEGIWMVSDCDHKWPNDKTRNKCETPVKRLTLSSPDISRYLPVVSHDNITFRNLHCALCNNVDTYDPWPVTIETTVIPPEHYNLTQKIQFLLLHAAKFPETEGPSRPKPSQPRRYCVKQVINSCPANKPSWSCTNGTTALVSSFGPHYKNIECAICHSFPTSLLSCFPTQQHGNCQSFFPQSFSLVLDYQRDSVENEEKSSFSIEKEACSEQGMIYDNILQVCRVNWLDPPDNSGQERFYVVAWLVPQRSGVSSFTPDDFQKSLAEYLNISATQLFNINISTIPYAVFYLVSSTIVLTPQQSLELLSRNKNSDNTWQPRIQEFIYFKNPIPLIIGNTNYTIAKTTSRPLVCAGRKVYSYKEYTLLDNDKVFINSTNTTYEKSQYFTENITLGNITICEKYSPAACKETWTILKPNEFIILANLSIVNKKTSQLYHYGQYDVLSNSSVAVCASTYSHKRTRITVIWDDPVLSWVSFACFLISIFGLIFLLVTYILFPKLQTLPGKNLMNLAVTLLLFDSTWILPGFSGVRSNRNICTAIAVLSHFFLLASFASMSVIAFHTCKVFARQLPAPKVSKGHEKRLFLGYLILVWIVPAMLVLIIFFLEEYDFISIGYGDSKTCWVNEKQAYYFSVTLPIILSLTFNITAFIRSVIYLKKHKKNQAAVTKSSGATQSNPSIYIKLSTLMGFSWLFGLLSMVIEPDEPFWYLFVIFTSLQGFFVTIAFVMNRKTLRLYQRVLHREQKSSSGTAKGTAGQRNTSNVSQDTKL